MKRYLHVFIDIAFYNIVVDFVIAFTGITVDVSSDFLGLWCPVDCYLLRIPNTEQLFVLLYFVRLQTQWFGKFKLGHLITRKHRSARANYWFNLKIFILWSSGEMLQEFVWKYLRTFLGIKNTVKSWIRNTSPHFHGASLSIWPLHVEKNLLCWKESVIHF